MRVIRIALYACMAIVLAGGWAFLYWQSSGLELDAANGARGALNGLRAIDARWNDQLVGARLLGAGGKAPLEPARHGSAYAALEVQALRLTHPQIGSALAGVKSALEEKTALAKRFAAARAELARLSPDAEGDDLKRAELTAAAQALFDQAWLAPTGPRLDALARTLDRASEDSAAQAELYRVWLLYYSGFLLAVLAYLVWNLASSRLLIERINRQLREANETLERRVAERTRELTDALAKLKESEALLVQSEKMSSLGQMVAGIAHEVNTPLAYVKASLESVRARVSDVGSLAAATERLLALLSAESPDEAQLARQFAAVRGRIEALRSRKALEEVERTVKDGLYGIGQISEIVANLRNFSRLDRSHVAEYDLHEGIESTIRIAHNQLKHRTVRKVFGELPRVSCSPSQINQVILNLLTNAAQATSDKDGTIIVRTGRRGANEVTVQVADNGQGIPEAVLPKIFDPFFTTKEVGKGTGLGLSISYKIVESHGGRLEVQSKPGVGTRFTIILPVTPPAALAA